MVELDKAHEVNNADFDEWHENVKNIFDIARKEIAIESARSRPFSSRTFGVKSAPTRNPSELCVAVGSSAVGFGGRVCGRTHVSAATLTKCNHRRLATVPESQVEGKVMATW